jgi:ABC-type nitrate/sulfonate/bicarbonate transport system substrate-binding protein
MVALLQAQRIDAAAAPEPTTSVILEQGPGRFRILPIFDENVWRSLAGTASVAYLGVAAQNRWIEANKDAVPRLFATYAAAVKWSNEHPADAGQVIGGATKLEPKALEMAITSGRMAFDVSPASQLKQSIEAVLDAGIQTQQLEQKPRVEDLIYDGL